MRISKKAEYALRALAAIARETRPRAMQELSAQERIPLKFLQAILLDLRHAGILASKRGVGGGCALARPASRISVGEIIRALDGPLAPVDCAGEQPAGRCTCPNPAVCVVRIAMTQLRESLAAQLDARSLEDLARLAPDPASLAFDI